MPGPQGRRTQGLQEAAQLASRGGAVASGSPVSGWLRRWSRGPAPQTKAPEDLGRAWSQCCTRGWQGKGPCWPLGESAWALDQNGSLLADRHAGGCWVWGIISRTELPACDWQVMWPGCVMGSGREGLDLKGTPRTRGLQGGRGPQLPALGTLFYIQGREPRGLPAWNGWLGRKWLQSS